MKQATDRRVRRGFRLVLYRMGWFTLVLTSTSLRGITSVIVVQVFFCFFSDSQSYCGQTGRLYEDVAVLSRLWNWDSTSIWPEETEVCVCTGNSNKNNKRRKHFSHAGLTIVIAVEWFECSFFMIKTAAVTLLMLLLIISSNLNLHPLCVATSILLLIRHCPSAVIRLQKLRLFSSWKGYCSI